MSSLLDNVMNETDFDIRLHHSYAQYPEEHSLQSLAATKESPFLEVLKKKGFKVLVDLSTPSPSSQLTVSGFSVTVFPRRVLSLRRPQGEEGP